jgi:C1A family cysteine protease
LHANAIAGVLQFDEIKEKKNGQSTPSRLFIYYNERVIEGTVKSDSGAQLRDGVKTVVRQGICPESVWPYNISKFAVKPPTLAYKDGAKDKATHYLRLTQVANQLKGCLASGYPFVFGFTVYQSFEGPDVAKTGIVPMPSPSETVLGGHAVCAVGYDDASNASSSATRGDRGGGSRAIAPCPTPTCWIPTWLLTSGLSARFDEVPPCGRSPDAAFRLRTLAL